MIYLVVVAAVVVGWYMYNLMPLKCLYIDWAVLCRKMYPNVWARANLNFMDAIKSITFKIRLKKKERKKRMLCCH